MNYSLKLPHIFYGVFNDLNFKTTHVFSWANVFGRISTFSGINTAQSLPGVLMEDPPNIKSVLGIFYIATDINGSINELL